MDAVTPAALTAFLDRFEISRRQAGGLLGRSKGMVSHWEKGRKPIPPYVGLWMAACEAAGEPVPAEGVEVVTPPLPKENRKKIDLRHHPEAEAEAIDTLTDPHWERLSDAARACGLNSQTARHLIERLRTRLQPVNTEIKRRKTSELIGLLEDRAGRALEYIDDVALAGASARDLAVVAGIMIEKRQLLMGEPTQILSVEDRRKLDELIPAMLREAQRRGMAVDLAASEFKVVANVTPTDRPKLTHGGHVKTI